MARFLYDWQTLIAGLAALLAAFIALIIPEWRARKALRASLAGEMRLYVDLLIKTREIIARNQVAFRSGKQPQRDFRDLALLQPPIVYPAAADMLGHVRRPSAAEVVEFYATIERVNFSVRAASNEPTERISIANYLTLIDLFEAACRKSLPLLSELPFDKCDADFRATIAKWDAEPPRQRTIR